MMAISMFVIQLLVIENLVAKFTADFIPTFAREVLFHVNHFEPVGTGVTIKQL